MHKNPRDSDAQPRASREPPEETTASVPDDAFAGVSIESYAAIANKRSKRSLMCMLRDARKKLAHHGPRSFMGKEAKKEIAAAEAELRSRGIDVPAEGEETVQWDK